LSVEDEWDRDPNIEDTEDLLFVTYDANKLDVPELLKRVEKEGFKSEVRE
jgi:hypothetical protein